MGLRPEWHSLLDLFFYLFEVLIYFYCWVTANPKIRSLEHTLSLSRLLRVENLGAAQLEVLDSWVMSFLSSHKLHYKAT